VEEIHRIEFQALGRVDGAENQVVLVERRRTGQLLRRLGRLEGQVGEEGRPVAEAGGDPLQRLEVPQPRLGVVVPFLAERRVEGADVVELRRQRWGHGRGQLLAEGEERRPPGKSSRRWPLGAPGVEATTGHHRLEQGACRAGPDAGKQTQHPRAGHEIAGVFSHPEEGQRVSDVGALHEAQTAVLVEGDAAAAELDLEVEAVVGGPEEHCLVAEPDSLLSSLEYPGEDQFRLLGLVSTRQQLRAGAAESGGDEVLGEALSGLGDDPVGRRQQLGRAAVVVDQEQPAHGGVAQRKVEDVPHRRRPEGVDRLRVVADHGEALTARPQMVEDFCLERVGVLVLVDQYRLELCTHRLASSGVLEEGVEEKEQIVVVEHPLRGLAVDIGAEEQFQAAALLDAPGEVRLHHAVERQAGIDAPTVDVETGGLARKSSLASPQLQLGAEHLQEIFGVAAVVDGEARVEPHPLAVLPEEPGGDGVERSAPDPARGPRFPVAEEPVDPAEQLARGAAGEGQQEDPIRRDASVDQMRHAVGERGGLSRSRPGDEQQRRVAMEHRLALPFVEVVEAHDGAATVSPRP